MSQRSTQRSEHSTAGDYVHPGEEFTRDTAYIEDRIVRDPARADVPEGARAWPVEAGRYRLVAARAGVSRRTIFNHFPSAQDAVFEYLSELVAGLIDGVLRDLPEPMTPKGTTAATSDVSLGDVYRQLIGSLRTHTLIEELQPVFSVDLQDTPAASLWGFRVTRTAVDRLNEVLRERLPQHSSFETHLVATTLINSFAECLDEWVARTGGELDERGHRIWDELLTTALGVLGRGFDS